MDEIERSRAFLSNEGAEDYPDIVARLGPDARLIRSNDTAPATQWIVQKRHRRGAKPDSWDGQLYFQEKAAMLTHYLQGIDEPEARAALDALPERCPQRPRRGRAAVLEAG